MLLHMSLGLCFVYLLISIVSALIYIVINICICFYQVFILVWITKFNVCMVYIEISVIFCNIDVH